MTSTAADVAASVSDDTIILCEPTQGQASIQKSIFDPFLTRIIHVLSDEEEDAAEKADYMWIIGVCLSFLGCCLANLGINMQKLAHNRRNAQTAATTSENDVTPGCSLGDVELTLVPNTNDSSNENTDENTFPAIPSTPADDILAAKSPTSPQDTDALAAPSPRSPASPGTLDSDLRSPASPGTLDGDSVSDATDIQLGAGEQLSDGDSAGASESGKKGSLLRDPVWLLGMTSVILGSVADLLSFSMAPMSLLAPLGAMTLVINLFTAPCFLGEALTVYDVGATIVILVGTVISLLFGSKSTQTYDLDELMALYRARGFIIYAFAVCAVVTALVRVLWLIRRKDRVQHKALTPREHAIEAFGYPFLSGVVGAHSVLFTKSTGEIVQQTIAGNNQFAHVLPYVFLVGLGVCLFSQVRLLNAALARADSLYVVPVYQVSWVLSNVVVSMAYFQDYTNMSSFAMGMFTFGVAVTCLGVGLLSFSRQKAHDNTVDDDGFPKGATPTRLDGPGPLPSPSSRGDVKETVEASV